MEDLKTVEPALERAKRSMTQKIPLKRRIPGLTPDEVEEGEEYIMSMKRLKCRPPAYFEVPPLEGELIMTNYKLVFKPILFPESTPS